MGKMYWRHFGQMSPRQPCLQDSHFCLQDTCHVSETLQAMSWRHSPTISTQKCLEDITCARSSRQFQRGMPARHNFGVEDISGNWSSRHLRTWRHGSVFKVDNLRWNVCKTFGGTVSKKPYLEDMKFSLKDGFFRLQATRNHVFKTGFAKSVLETLFSVLKPNYFLVWFVQQWWLP